MATIIDVSLFQAFDVVYPIIFIFAVVYAILQKFKFPTDSMMINGIIAVMVAFMTLLSRKMIDLLNFVIPWFAIAIIFFVLILLIFMVFGAKEGDILAYLKSGTQIGWVIVGVSIIIILAGFGHVMGQEFTQQAFNQEDLNATASDGTATGDFQQNINAIFFNPKVLGFVVIFIIAIFAVLLLGS